MNPDRSYNLSLKYQRFTPSGCKGIGIRKFRFVAITQFLCEKVQKRLCEKKESIKLLLKRIRVQVRWFNK